MIGSRSCQRSSSPAGRYFAGAAREDEHYPLYLLLLLGQAALLVSGVVGFLLQQRGRKLGVFGKPYYFLLTNVASLVATVSYLRGERMVTWNPIR